MYCRKAFFSRIFATCCLLFFKHLSASNREWRHTHSFCVNVLWYYIICARQIFVGDFATETSIACWLSLDYDHFQAVWCNSDFNWCVQAPDLHPTWLWCSNDVLTSRQSCHYSTTWKFPQNVEKLVLSCKPKRKNSKVTTLGCQIVMCDVPVQSSSSSLYSS